MLICSNFFFSLFSHIALDPAGPCFYYNALNNPLPLPPLYCGTSGGIPAALTGDVGCANRVCNTDAIYVDVIHTSKAFGIVPAIGHADYYPNGGVSQPGCADDLFHPGWYIIHVFDTYLNFVYRFE
jgi:hypothetical protein